MLVAINYFQLHPYEYTYFNALTGSQSGANGKFEIDYWGATDKHSLEWLKNETNNQPVKIYMCSKSVSLGYYYPEAIDSNHDIWQADYVICHDPMLMKSLAKKLPGKTVYEVEKAGVTYSIVFEIDQSKVEAKSNKFFFAFQEVL